MGAFWMAMRKFVVHPRPLIFTPMKISGINTFQYIFSRVLTFIFLLPILFFTSRGFSQTSSVTIIRDARVDTLVSRYAEAHRSKAGIEGYRVQVAAGSNRNNVYKVKSDFYRQFPSIKQYLIYQAPNFKLRVGNYRTRLEAYRDLQKIIPSFNGAFIIRDEIKLSEL